MRAVVEEQLAPAARVELEAVRDVHRPGLVDDDRVAVGPLRHLPGDAIRLERTRIPGGFFDTSARSCRARALNARTSLCRSAIRALSAGVIRSFTAASRSSVPYATSATSGAAVVMTLPMLAASFRMSMNAVLRETIGVGRVVLKLVADVDDDIHLGRIRQRLDAPARNAAHPERMLLRKVGVHLARLRHRQREQLGELHDLVERLRLVDLVADDEQRTPGFDEQLRRALHLHRVRPDAHPRVHLVVADDLRRDASPT